MAQTPADAGIQGARQESAAYALGKRFVDQHGEYLGYLRDRWSDEKEYEQWSDYEKIMREKFTGFLILRVVKVGVVLSDGVNEVTIKATANSINMKVALK